jgi:lycopene cyclase domain-containing protein
MTYFRFHAFFNLPVLAILLCWPANHGWGGVQCLAAAWVFLAVYVFTTPWDNYAVAKGIWDFADDKHWKRLWRLPVEEYLFFGLQTFEVLLLVNGLIGLLGTSHTWDTPPLGSGIVLGSLGVLAVAWVFAAQAGNERPRRFNYAWHLFYWFLPIIAAQWIIGWGILAPRYLLLVIPTLAIGGWLTFADVLAVRSGLWFFDAKQVTGLRLFHILPWEEAAFFFLTSLLVAQSYLLLLPEAAR